MYYFFLFSIRLSCELTWKCATSFLTFFFTTNIYIYISKTPQIDKETIGKLCIHFKNYFIKIFKFDFEFIIRHNSDGYRHGIQKYISKKKLYSQLKCQFKDLSLIELYGISILNFKIVKISKQIRRKQHFKISYTILKI